MDAGFTCSLARARFPWHAASYLAFLLSLTSAHALEWSDIEQDVVHGWQALASQTTELHAVYEEVRTEERGQKVSVEKRSIAVDHTSGVFRVVAEKHGVNATSIWARNRDYCFSIGRRNAEEPWQIAYAGNAPNNSVLEAGLATFGWPIGVSHSLLDVSMVEIVALQSFHAGTVNRVGDGIGEVELTFWIDPSDSVHHALVPVRSGTIKLLPERSWAVSGYDVQYDTGTRGVAEVEYAVDSDADFLRPTRFDFRLTPDAKEKRELRLVHWDSRLVEFDQRSQPDASLYRLSGYGLPEYVDPTFRGWRFVFTLVIVALVVLALAAILRRRALRLS